MFHILDGKRDHKHKDLINKFLTHVGKEPTPQRSTKIIYSNDGVFGGAQITREACRAFGRKIGLNAMERNNGAFFLVQDIVFDVENQNIIEDLSLFTWHCEKFYKELYETIFTFCINNDLSNIFLFIPQLEFEDIQLFGKWPYSCAIGFDNDMILLKMSIDRSSFSDFSLNWGVYAGMRPQHNQEAARIT